MTALIEYVSKFTHALNAVNGFLKLFFNTRHSNLIVAISFSRMRPVFLVCVSPHRNNARYLSCHLLCQGTHDDCAYRIRF